MRPTGTAEYVARIVAIQPSALFLVELENGNRVQVHVALEARLTVGRLRPGDNVWITLSPYDLTRGRIIRRCR